MELAVYLEGREQPKVKISCTLVLLNFAKNVPVPWEKLTLKAQVSSVSCTEHNYFSPCSGVTIKGLGCKWQLSSARERQVAILSRLNKCASLLWEIMSIQ